MQFRQKYKMGEVKSLELTDKVDRGFIVIIERIAADLQRSAGIFMMQRGSFGLGSRFLGIGVLMT